MAIASWYATQVLVSTAAWQTTETTAAAGAAPTITTSSLAAGTVGTAYSQTLAATGPTPITWGISAGVLPAGVTRSGATISGTPTAAGSYAITVTATNANGVTSKTLTIAIASAPVVEKLASPWARWLRR